MPEMVPLAPFLHRNFSNSRNLGLCHWHFSSESHPKASVWQGPNYVLVLGLSLHGFESIFLPFTGSMVTTSLSNQWMFVLSFRRLYSLLSQAHPKALHAKSLSIYLPVKVTCPDLPRTEEVLRYCLSSQTGKSLKQTEPVGHHTPRWKTG